MESKQTKEICKNRGAFTLFLLILFFVFSIAIILIAITDRSNNRMMDIVFKMISCLFCISVFGYFLLSYINMKIEIYKDEIKYTNLFGTKKIFRKENFIEKRSPATSGYRYIFTNGRFDIYMHYTNYENTYRYLRNWLEK